VRRGDLAGALSEASELPRPLPAALALLGDAGDPRHPRWAARWAARFTLDHDSVDLEVLAELCRLLSATAASAPAARQALSSLGLSCLPRSRPLARATFMPSRVHALKAQLALGPADQPADAREDLSLADGQRGGAGHGCLLEVAPRPVRGHCRAELRARKGATLAGPAPHRARGHRGGRRAAGASKARAPTAPWRSASSPNARRSWGRSAAP
jgi:hypothetical protein